jgi:hypothetical protein
VSPQKVSVNENEKSKSTDDAKIGIREGPKKYT